MLGGQGFDDGREIWVRAKFLMEKYGDEAAVTRR